MIALVQRPRRRMHLASKHGEEWWTVCDRIVPAAGTAVFPVDLALVGSVALQPEQTAQLCAECERMITFAGTVAALNRASIGKRLGRAA